MDLDYEERAAEVFGKKLTKSLITTFNREAKGHGFIETYLLEYLLRYCGLSPSKQQVEGFSAGCSVVTLNSFLDFAIRCAKGNPALNDLVDFFSRYDNDKNGLIPESVFRSLMLECGERFLHEEYEAVMKAFGSDENMGFIDYRSFITMYV